MKPARILVVDDEPGIRQSLCGVLGDDGYLAHAVGSGEESLEDLTREPSDLVLLDTFSYIFLLCSFFLFLWGYLFGNFRLRY